ncbi:vascular cell adhesion protein 1 isoform X2 [Rousettus aegyptiacus]|uniref:Vascular cell adhesion protein 1 n=1 Tax=Rousettus aegyptiacus TaxID=9407 RepID=A0A7J8BIY4_ROUAE|nr:vascular cell adhesion protein 1 isoform X2 [Rousettus aegyptiacus]KAF6398376.1 vascular cell adhesion molecule 1 [Rousettus aegyptiacus]
MPGKMVVILGALNVLWMVFVVSQAFKIEIFPKSKIIAQIGASVSLTCSTVGCESPSFSWRTQIDSPLSAKVRSEGNTSTLTMDPVGFENEHSYLCTATCGSGKQEKEIKVQIYSFPKDPEIYLSGPLEVGKLVTVTCLVPDVYPFDRLEMDLLKDNQNLKSQYFLEPTEKKSLETKSLEVTFTPTNEDTGKDLVCRAKLLVDEIDVEYEKRETTEKLQVYIAPRDTVIFVNPSTRLQEGDSVTMTCSSEGLPAPQILWSKKLDNSNLQLLSENATLTLIAMRMEDSGIYVCEGVNIIGRNRKEMELIVQEKSFTVEISPGPQVVAQVGDSVMLTCSATGCESPSFSWRTQIDSPLNGKVSSEGTTSTLTLSPVSLENEHSYLCTATCGHKKLEKGIKVDLYSFPRDPEIETSGVLVDGNPVTISCKVPHVYPLDRLEIELLKGESVMKSKHFFEDEHKKSLETKSLEITFVPTTEDTGKVLVCQAKLNIDEMEFEPKQRQSTQTIYVNVAPKDIKLTAFPSESVKEGETVIISCTCRNVPKTWIILKKKAETGDTVLKSTDGAYTIHKVQLEDAGVYECESKNDVGLQLRSIKLDVKGRESNKDYFSPELLMLYCASSLIIPAIGMIIYFARKANMKGSYSLVEAQKSKV